MSPTELQNEQRNVPTPFLMKTYKLVDDVTFNDIISWNASGSTFIVWRPGEFARDILPQRFKHNNFSSFVRQLNTYGFKKISSDRWEFAHEFFHKGEEQLLYKMERRKFSSATTLAAVLAIPDEPVPASDLSKASGGMVKLMEENEQLRRENARLSLENMHMKGVCNNIQILVSNYTHGNVDNDINDLVVEVSPQLQKNFEERGNQQRTTEVGEQDNSRLFGVQIRSQRICDGTENLLVKIGSSCSDFFAQEDEEELRLGFSYHGPKKRSAMMDTP